VLLPLVTDVRLRCSVLGCCSLLSASVDDNPDRGPG
jgi:hypothetical protein